MRLLKYSLDTAELDRYNLYQSMAQQKDAEPRYTGSLIKAFPPEGRIASFIEEARPHVEDLITGKINSIDLAAWIDAPEANKNELGRAAIVDADYEQLDGFKLLTAIRHTVEDDSRQQYRLIADLTKHKHEAEKANVARERKGNEAAERSGKQRRKIASKVNGGTEFIPVTKKRRTVTVFRPDGTEEVITVIGVRDTGVNLPKKAEVVHIADTTLISLSGIKSLIENSPHITTIQIAPSREQYFIGPGIKAFLDEKGITIRTGRVVQHPNFDEDKPGVNHAQRLEIYERALQVPELCQLIDRMEEMGIKDFSMYKEYINGDNISLIAGRQGLPARTVQRSVAAISALLGDATCWKQAVERARAVRNRLDIGEETAESMQNPTVLGVESKTVFDQAADF